MYRNYRKLINFLSPLSFALHNNEPKLLSSETLIFRPENAPKHTALPIFPRLRKVSECVEFNKVALFMDTQHIIGHFGDEWNKGIGRLLLWSVGRAGKGRGRGGKVGKDG